MVHHRPLIQVPQQYTTGLWTHWRRHLTWPQTPDSCTSTAAAPAPSTAQCLSRVRGPTWRQNLHMGGGGLPTCRQNSRTRGSDAAAGGKGRRGRSPPSQRPSSQRPSFVKGWAPSEALAEALRMGHEVLHALVLMSPRRTAASSLRGGPAPGAPASLPPSLSCHVPTPLAGSDADAVPLVPFCPPSSASSALTRASCSASRLSFSFGRCLGFFLGVPPSVGRRRPSPAWPLSCPLFPPRPCRWPLQPSADPSASAERRRDEPAPAWGPLSSAEDSRVRLSQRAAKKKGASAQNPDSNLNSYPGRGAVPVWSLYLVIQLQAVIVQLLPCSVTAATRWVL